MGRANRLKILAYKGISWGSRLIRFYTRSEYSHVAIEWDSGKVTEALTKYGVILSNDYEEHHAEGTRVEVFDLIADEEMAWSYARSCHGDRYDLSALGRFVTKRKRHTPKKWFCSELTYQILKAGGTDILMRVNPETLSPGDVVSSPRLSLVEARVC